MFGENCSRVAQPCVVQVRIQRHQQTAPRSGVPSSFLVSIHEEASVITWQRAITIKPEVEQQLVDGVAQLHTWSLGLGDSAKHAAKSAKDLGRVIHIDDDRVRDYLKNVVRGSVEETLAGRRGGTTCNASRYERTRARRDTRGLQPQAADAGGRGDALRRIRRHGTAED